MRAPVCVFSTSAFERNVSQRSDSPSAIRSCERRRHGGARRAERHASAGDAGAPDPLLRLPRRAECGAPRPRAAPTRRARPRRRARARNGGVDHARRAAALRARRCRPRTAPARRPAARRRPRSRVSTRARCDESATNSGTTAMPASIVPRLCGSSAQASTSDRGRQRDDRAAAPEARPAATASSGQKAIAPSAAVPFA